MAQNLPAQIQSLNQRLTLNQKLSIGALGLVVLMGIFAFVYLIRNESYQILFSNLDAESARSVTARLDQLAIPYSLEDSGRSILVPQERINEARIEVASQALPSSGRIGFELFDQSNWGLTDFAEKVNFRRALEGELERTIRSLSEIAHARVHLALAKESLFEKQALPAKASVVLNLKSGQSLRRNRIEGIRNLVAFAVEGLYTENVTIVDVDGNMLSGPTNQQEVLSATQLELRRKIENEMSQKVVSILTPLVGPEKVRATASVELDFAETEQTEQIFDPQSAVVISQQRSEERSGPGEAARGIPFQANEPQGENAPDDGNATDNGNAPVSTAGDRPDGRSRQTEMINYEVNKTVRQTRLPKGTLRRISLAVVVDDKVVSVPNGDGEIEETSEPRSAEELERLRNIVSASVGFSAERGDSLTLENISFSARQTGGLPELLEPGFLEKYEIIYRPLVRYMTIVLLFLLFYALIFRPVKNRVFSFVELDSAAQGALTAGEGAAGQARLSGGEPGSAGALKGAEEAFSEKALLKKQLVSMAESEPAMITQVIKSWLSGGN